MKKNFVKVLAAVTVSSVLATNVSFASEPLARKNETIYVTKEAGNIKDETVSVWISSDKNVDVKDKTNLKDIKNLKTDEAVNAKDGYVNWKTDSNDVYYQGKSDEKLPVEVNVKYFLDGKEISFEELKGKSGHLKVVTEAINTNKTKAKIDGKDQEIYSPYVVLTEVSFNDDKVSNIKTDDGKIIKDGKNNIVAGVLTPGLRENFDGILEADKLDKFKSEMEIEMDVTDYEPSEVYTLITNEFFQDEANLGSLDDLKDGIGKLEDNAVKLVDASEKLSEGGKKLNDGINQLDNGASELANGSATIVESFDKFSNAFADLPSKVKPIGEAVNQLSDGANQLNDGVNKYTAGVSEINKNMGALNSGAAALEKGASDLDEGLLKLSQGTGELRKQTSMIGGASDTKKLTGSMSELKTGLDNFSKNVTPLASSMNEMSAGLSKLDESSKTLSGGLSTLNEKAKNAPSPAASIENINAKANAIDAVIVELEANNEDGSLNGQIENLRAIQNGLYNEAANLKASAQYTLGLAQAIGELSAGSSELSAGISKANAGASEMNKQISGAKDQLQAASSGLATGVEKIENGFSESNIAALNQAIIQIDEGANSLKAGSAKLKAGTSQNKDGVAKLSGAINKLDQNSASLKTGSNKLANGLAEFKSKAGALNQLADVNEKAINPMAAGLKKLNEGIIKLKDSTNKLKDGSNQYTSSYEEFNKGLHDYKSQGIDELSNKTGDVEEISDILSQMQKLAQENNSLSGSTADFETKSRIIQKTK